MPPDEAASAVLVGTFFASSIIRAACDSDFP
jgi:hypothetical protein